METKRRLTKLTFKAIEVGLLLLLPVLYFYSFEHFVVYAIMIGIHFLSKLIGKNPFQKLKQNPPPPSEATGKSLPPLLVVLGSFGAAALLLLLFFYHPYWGLGIYLVLNIMWIIVKLKVTPNMHAVTDAARSNSEE